MVAAAQTQTMRNSEESAEENQQQRIGEKEAFELWGAGACHPPNLAVIVYGFGILNQVERLNFMIGHPKSSGEVQFHDLAS